uniref:NADH-ubiquinone oxidoreductase chain 5 n=1 Tax=Dicyrtomina saundersi TaxID=438492 RepID=A0A516EZT2_9HEXA|nr:NADH dehydrogenase subunit 5 [Dicyrtomina saundersi]QDO72016.1 NADH dehydrogenase subunit 5 [Dicyrtomina saundersi]
MKLLSICFYLGLMLFSISMVSVYLSLIFYSSSFTLFLEWEILNFNSFSMVMLFLLDWMSLSFMSVVLLISSMVLFYSHSYMKGDSNLVKFIFLVFLFVVSMIFMIMSPNLISILLGWDGLGLVSYCLVIYYQNNKSANAGMITILSNRIGDVAILLAISWMLNFGSCNFYFLPLLYSNSLMLILLFLITIAAMTKSAQIPFSAWLPAAMAAPTPVSSLVHSSTLVTAGVYLLIRFSNVINFHFVLFVIAVSTMIMSGVGANYETDLKKVIALSTLSQLGVMMMILSLGMVELSYFHLLSHAMFKSLLFLCAGFYIHSMGDCQDIRFLGSLWIGSPIISLFFFASSISLCGFPFMAGFYSSDMILEFFFMGSMNLFMLVIIYLATILTLMYSIRLMAFVFMGLLSYKTVVNKQDDLGMVLPMSILFILSIVGGSTMFWTFFPQSFIYLSFYMKIMVLISLTLIFLFVMNKIMLKSYITKSSFFISLMWGLPYISSMMFINLLHSGLKYLSFFDQGWLEFFGGKKSYSLMTQKTGYIDKFNTLGVKNYLLFFLLVSVMSCQFI